MDKYKEKLDSLDDISRRSCYNYFTKSETIESLLDIIRAKMDVCLEPYGNFNARVVYIVDFNKTNDPILELIKKFYSLNNSDFYSLYFTPYNKTKVDAINQKILAKELEVIQPNRVIILGDFAPNTPASVMSLSCKELDILLSCMADESVAKENEAAFNDVKEKFKSIIKFSIYGN